MALWISTIILLLAGLIACKSGDGKGGDGLVYGAIGSLLMIIGIVCLIVALTLYFSGK